MVTGVPKMWSSCIGLRGLLRVCTVRAAPEVTRWCARFHLSVLKCDGESAQSVRTFMPDYESVKLLERADSQVQNIFSLDMASHREHSKAAVADTISQMQTRPGDTGSTTVQIAVLTLRIKQMSEHMKKHRKDYGSLRCLVQLVHRRRKLLLYLKRSNFQNYLKIVSELNLRHPVNDKYPKKSVSHQNRIAKKQKKNSRPFLKK